MIREIKECELEPLLDLYTHLHDEDTSADKEEIRRAWTAIMSDEKIRYFVVEEDHRIIACCHIVLIPNLTRGARPYALIENVVTHSDFRRMGYGKKLLEYSLRWAWESGCYKVMLMTGRYEQEVDDFYNSVGFVSGVKRAFIARPPML